MAPTRCWSGGVASGTAVLGGVEIVQGGVASGSFVTDGMLFGTEYNGAQEVAAGGVTSDTSVVAGGVETILAGGMRSAPRSRAVAAMSSVPVGPPASPS